MKDKILVVGGYGQVGRYVALSLFDKFPDKVIVAGRNLAKANSFSAEHNNSFETMELDINNIGSISMAMKNVKIAIICLSAENNIFAEYCIKNGIHYVDISPSYDSIKGIEQFKEDAINYSSTCVLGVGLTPGLSNILVKKALKEFDILQKVSINLLLGLGETHGDDGVKWFLDSIYHDYYKCDDGVRKKNKPFIGKNKTTFGKPLYTRATYPFNLADQFILQKTLNIENVASYYCYDSKVITAYVSILKRIGLFALLRWKISYNIILKSFILFLKMIHKLNIGSDIFGVQVDAFGVRNCEEHTYHIGAVGYNNSLLTAEVTAFVATRLYEGNLPCGVFYIEELFSLSDMDELLSNVRVYCKNK